MTTVKPQGTTDPALSQRVDDNVGSSTGPLAGQPNYAQDVQARIGAATQELTGLTSTLGSVNGRLAAQLALASSLEGQLDQLSQKRSAPNLSDDDRKKLDEQIRSLSQQFDYANASVTDLRGQAATLGNQIAQQQATIDGLRSRDLPDAEGKDRQVQARADDERATEDRERAAQQAAESNPLRQNPQKGPLDIDYQAESRDKQNA